MKKLKCLVQASLAIIVFLASAACGSGSDEGGTLTGHWSGSLTCEGSLAYSYGFNLDGDGEVSGVKLRSTFQFSACPGGPATVTCSGSGTYNYQQSGRRFDMQVSYSGCKCGGVSVNMLNSDSFSGTFNGSNTLSGSGGCRFSFKR